MKIIPAIVLSMLFCSGVVSTSYAVDRAWTGATGNWGTSTNWNPNSNVFNNTVDLTFQAGGGSLGSNFLGGGNRVIRSLTYAGNLTTANVNHALANQFNDGTIGRTLEFESDSGNSFIAIESGALSNINIGAGTSTQGNIVLSNNLDITHNGSGVLALNRPITGTSRTVSISGTGRTVYSSANSYTGATNINGGTLLISGSTSGGNAVSVASGAVIGGSGTINGNLSLSTGALFAFDASSTLNLGGSLSLDSSFGIASLRSSTGGLLDWATVMDGTYTLINTTFTFNETNISNFGFANRATGLAGGKEAYFQNGSLQLVVIPEPGTWALLAVGLIALIIFRRRSVER